jgi:glycine cleavage system P protein (glycine dehydrogenase)
MRARRLSVYLAGARGDKHWSPVNRVDNVYGDRNSVCTCPPMTSYGEAAQ